MTEQSRLGVKVSLRRNRDRLRRRLIRDARACRVCPRMACSRRVLSDLNGSWGARILIVGEAPGRLGAERTGIPFFGDRTGDRFDALLAAMRWRRSDLFVTNAVLCNPRDEDGNNDAPARKEIVNCSLFLRRTIEVVNPAFVIALGRVALNALSLISGHSVRLRDSAGRIAPWFGRNLGVLYHPGPRSAVHRSWRTQLRDARTLSKAVGRVLCRRVMRS